MSRTNFNELLQAGVHFGHLKKKYNPAMAPYIFMEKNGIHIIDLNKTVAMLEDAAAAMKQIAKSGKKILFVATKKQAKGIVAENAALLNMPYITERWPGGLLTNFATIRKSIKKMQTIDKMKEDGTFDTLSKRERLQIDRQRAKLDLNLGSIVKMTRMPEAIFIIDTNKENIALAEANKLGIRSFAMNDTNTNPLRVSFPIPANDDASKSIECILSIVSKAIAEGLAERDVDQAKKAKEKKEKAKQITEGIEEEVTVNQDEKSVKKKEKSRKRIQEK
jgi:small subunit ribosomal protein S2